MGVQGHTVDEPRAVPQMVATSVCNQFQDANARHPRAARLPSRRERRLPAFHHAAAPWRALEDALLPRRRPLVAEAAELRTLVEDGQRLVRSLDEEVNGAGFKVSKFQSFRVSRF